LFSWQPNNLISHLQKSDLKTEIKWVLWWNCNHSNQSQYMCSFIIFMSFPSKCNIWTIKTPILQLSMYLWFQLGCNCLSLLSNCFVPNKFSIHCPYFFFETFHLLSHLMLCLSIKSMVWNNLVLRKQFWQNHLPMYLSMAPPKSTDFPEPCLDELREITIGVYQMKQTPCYTTKYLTEDWTSIEQLLGIL
jgi:hypothetical protein